MILTTLPKFLIFLGIALVLTVVSIPNDSQMGVIYFNSYKYEEALYYFDKSKNNNIATPTILKKMKDYFVIHGKIGKAIAAQKKLTKILPKNIVYWRELSQLYKWNNNTYESLKVDEKIASLSSLKDRDKLLLSIQAGYRWLRKFDDANRIGEMLYLSDDKETLIVNLNYHLSVKNLKEVIRHINKIETLDPNSQHLKKYLAQAYEINGNIIGAIKSYITFFKGNLQAADKYYNSSSLFENETKTSLQKKYPTVIKILFLYKKMNSIELVAKLNEQFYLIDRSEIDRALDAAQSYIKLNLEKDAINLLDQTLSYRSASRQYRAALLFIQLNKTTKAEKRLLKAINLYSTNPIYYNTLTELYEASGRVQDALKIQYQLVKALSKNKRTYINMFEVLYASSVKNSPINKNLLNAQSKILDLLEKLGDKDQLEAEVIKFYKNNPNDYEIKKKYAFILLSNKEYDKASKILTELHAQNYMDDDVTLALSEDLIRDNDYKNAELMLSKVKNNKLRKESLLMQIYRETDPSLANQICDRILKKPYGFNNYTEVDMATTCLNDKRDFRESTEILLNELNKDSKNIPAKFKLGYTLIESRDIKQAKQIERELQQENISQSDVRIYSGYLKEMEKLIAISQSWEHSYKLLYFSGQSFSNIWHEYVLIKNTENFFYGISIEKFFASNHQEGSDTNSIRLGLKPKANLEFFMDIGKNSGLDDGIHAQFGLSHTPSSQWFYNINLNFNRIVHEIENFNSFKGSKKNSQSIYSEYKFNFSNYLESFIEFNQFIIDEQKAKSTIISNQYNHYLLKNWTVGLQLMSTTSKSDAAVSVGSTPGINGALIEKSLLYAFNLRNRKVYNLKLVHQFDLYLGGDDERGIDFGKYYSVRESLQYNIDTITNVYARWDYSAEELSFYNNAWTITLGFNQWF